MNNIFNFVMIFLYDIPVFVLKSSELKEKVGFSLCWFFLAVIFRFVSIDTGQFLSVLISLSVSYGIMLVIWLIYLFFKISYLIQEEI